MTAKAKGESRRMRAGRTESVKPTVATRSVAVEAIQALDLTPNPDRKVQGGPGRDFERVTITMSPDWAHALRLLGAERRRVGQPGSLSEMVREALAAWLKKEGGK